MKPLGLRTQLTLIYAIVFSVLLAGFGGIFYHTLATRMERNFDEELQDRAAGLRGYLRFRRGEPQLAFDQADPEEARFIHSATRYYRVFEITTGRLLVQSRDLELIAPETDPAEVKALAQGPTFSDLSTPHGRLRFCNYVVRDHPRRAFLKSSV